MRHCTCRARRKGKGGSRWFHCVPRLYPHPCCTEHFPCSCICPQSTAHENGICATASRRNYWPPAPLRRPGYSREEISTKAKERSNNVYSVTREAKCGKKQISRTVQETQNFPCEKRLAVLEFQAERYYYLVARFLSLTWKRRWSPVDSKVTRITGDRAAGSRGQKQPGRLTMEERKTG